MRLLQPGQQCELWLASGDDGHIYRASLAGGLATRIMDDDVWFPVHQDGTRGYC